MPDATSQLIRGDTMPIDVEIKAADGTPEDITGNVFTVTFKSPEKLKSTTSDDSDADLQYTYTVPSGADASAGLASLSVPASKTKDLAPGMYWYDLQRKIPGSEPQIYTLIRETIEVLADVTRTT